MPGGRRSHPKGLGFETVTSRRGSGLLTATARLVAQGESVGPTSSAGTPAELALKRFGRFKGSSKRNGVSLGNVVSAEITYANNLHRIETIPADGRIDGTAPSIVALTGRIEVRFADQTLVRQAIDGDPCEMEFAYSLPSGERFTFGIGRMAPGAAGSTGFWLGSGIRGSSTLRGQSGA